MDRGRLTVDLERRFRGGPAIAASFEVDLDAGERLVLFGPSGSGKSTVLRCLAGLDRPTAGTVTAGRATWVDVASGRFLRPQDRRVGYVPQGAALFPHLTVEGNLLFGMGEKSSTQRRGRLASVIELVGLGGLAHRRAGTLSGGERQRVALGRALARDPLVLLLDEPLAALDTPTRESLRSELRELLRRSGVPAIVVTHDRTEALVLGDRVAVLVEGRVRQVGPAADVFNRPADAIVARVTGIETVVAGSVETAGDGLVTVRVGKARLTAVSDAPVGEGVLVTVRPEDVLLLAEDGGTAGYSARNHLQGTVVQAEVLGALVRVRLDCGFRLDALVTRRAFEELGVHPGGRVGALVKAPSVHVIRGAS